MSAAVDAVVQVTAPGGRSPQLAVLFGGQVRTPPRPLAGLDMMAALADWDRTAELLRAHDGGEPLPGARVLAPLTYPNKVICAGANYTDHMAEMGLPAPTGRLEPYFFFKPPTTTIIGPGDPIPMPAGEDVRLDFEAELAVVIAHQVRDVAPEDALGHVAGYAVANDVSARGHFRRAEPLGPAFALDWIGHKGQDGFCPLGPGVVPAWRIPDHRRLPLRTWVNGELRQDGSTHQMLVSIPEQIAALSRRMTLEPGDVLLTGTPAGVGAGDGRFLGIGDTVRIEIGGVGELTNRVGAHPVSTIPRWRATTSAEGGASSSRHRGPGR
jgi:2-keto-4-pentenoate hydratase/2-oxohepta-3-ene-1,7-dioic acid hydratase in catechol pathway